MICISHRQLFEFAQNFYSFKQEEEYVNFNRFFPKQMDFFSNLDFWDERKNSSSSVVLKFNTDARTINFAYRLKNICTKDDGIDVYVDDFFFNSQRLSSISDEGDISLQLPEGNKNISIYLPFDSEIWLKDFYFDGEVKPISKPQKKLLIIGDSITHGAGAKFASLSYVNCLSRKLVDYEILNQGMGGFYFESSFLTTVMDYTPDLIMTFLGTNRYKDDDRNEKIEDFFKKISENYNGIPQIAVSPLNRTIDLFLNRISEEEFNAFCGCGKRIKEVTQKYGIKFVDGFKLLPKYDLFLCDGLHPSDAGHMLLAENIYRSIKGTI